MMVRGFGWERFPLYLIASMLVVFAVNGRFIYKAVTTFPGEASGDDFDLSNRYDAVLQNVARQAALGWKIDAKVDRAALHLFLKAKDGGKLVGAQVAADVMRPMGPEHLQQVVFVEHAPGVYDAPVALETGQWDAMLRIEAGHDKMRVTQRIIVR